MVFFNYATMQMAAKIVYYGPGLCGKTTNLHHIYSKTSPGSRGEMVSLETETDRTLFFDLLPIDVGVIGGFKTRLQLYTVPGQVFYNTTRKLVLKGVDGLVFVADSQVAMLEANVESLKNLRENLREIGLNLDDIPLVIQLNKRDLPNIATADAMLDALDPDRRHDHMEAVASAGTGVFETLKLISKLTLRTLRRRMTGEEPTRTAPVHKTVAEVAQFVVKQRPEATAVAQSEPTVRTIAEEIEEVTADEEVFAPPAEVTLAPPPPPPAPDPALEPSPDPVVEFRKSERAKAAPPVKTVKVRSEIDVMAELEALRKRATAGTPKAAKKEAPSVLELLQKRDVQKTVSVQLPPDVLPRTRSVRVTLSFEDKESAVLQQDDRVVELHDASDIESLSLNVKIEQI